MVNGFFHLAGRFHQAYAADRLDQAERAGLRRKKPTPLPLRDRVGHRLIALGERMARDPRDPQVNREAA